MSLLLLLKPKGAASTVTPEPEAPREQFGGPLYPPPGRTMHRPRPKREQPATVLRLMAGTARIRLRAPAPSLKLELEAEMARIRFERTPGSRAATLTVEPVEIEMEPIHVTKRR